MREQDRFHLISADAVKPADGRRDALLYVEEQLNLYWKVLE